MVFNRRIQHAIFVPIVYFGLAILQFLPPFVSADGCPFDGGTRSDFQVTIRRDGRLLPSGEQAFLPSSTILVEFESKGLPGLRIAVNNSEEVEKFKLKGENETCTSEDGTSYLLFSGSSISIQTPEAGTTGGEQLILSLFTFSNSASTTKSQEVTISYQCGCPTNDCLPCMPCKRDCPVGEELTAQECGDVTIPNSICMPTPERQALLDLREMSNILEHKWNNSDHCLFWEHVVCNNDSRVSKLQLDGISLNGQLPESLVELEALEELSIPDAGIPTFPAFVKDFHNLKKIDLARNPLGPSRIPSFVWLLPLRYLNLSETKLIGNLSTEMVVLSSSFEYVDISNNFLMGSAPRPANAEHIITMKLRQANEFQFDCSNVSKRAIVFGPNVTIDINDEECTVCGATYDIDNIVSLPAPSSEANGTVLYQCNTGFSTSQTEATFELKCMRGKL